MAKYSIRDFWAKRTEKKGLDPEVRSTLLKGYEPPSGSSQAQTPAAAPEHHTTETPER